MTKPKVIVCSLLIVLGLVAGLWGFATLDNARDWNVPGATTGPGRNSLAK